MVSRFPRVEILGVHISAINLRQAVETISTWIDSRDRQYVCVTGVHGVMECQKDEELRAIHNSSGLTTPDGMPMVWLGKMAGADWMTRVYGPDLMLALASAGVPRGWKHFFYGGADGTPELLSSRLKSRVPGLAVVGTHSPPFRELSKQEVEEMAAMINGAAPDIVWVGLSTPKQERWMAEFREFLDAPVLLGVGAAFDIHSGVTRQAPRWMQRSGLEWLFRLGIEPGRLWRRYLFNNPTFILLILKSPPKLVT